MPATYTSTFKLDPAPKVITFDCYGTLVQWYEVLLREIDAVLARHAGSGATASAILDSFSAEGRRLTAEKPHLALQRHPPRSGLQPRSAKHGLARARRRSRALRRLP